ncbi:Protein MON2 -like protein [Echinococcus granulosus]|nr:Protein MON2 -like protein [Echinococcus granulosus]
MRNSISRKLSGIFMCKVAHTELRKLAVDAIILLIKRVIIVTTPTSNFWNNAELTQLVLEPLTQLTDINFDDVQEKQLQCVQYLLNCYGDEINGGWLRFINIIGSISQSDSDKHIRSAFQCFQLVVTDYLPTLGLDCYPACVDTAAKFGHQEHDLNIALAAVGSLLHLTDFLFQRERSTPEEARQIEPLWVTVFRHFSTLVRDRRPAMRKSASQTLFNAIECHSAQFVQDTWFELLWTVFFPLLSDVQDHCANAPMEREGRSGNLLVHHSRDTAAKQWAETVVLTLSGVARCFVSKQSQLVSLNRFFEIWERLLSNAERAVLTPNSEIAQNALSTLRILLDFDTSQCAIDKSTATWLAFWRTWVSIGGQFIDFFSASNSSEDITKNEAFQSQNTTLQKPAACTFGPDFFALFFDLFPPLFPRVQQNFNGAFFAEFSKIASQGVLGPLLLSHQPPLSGVNGLRTTATTITPSFMSSFTANVVDEQGLTQTQRSVFNCLSVIGEAIQTNESTFQILLVPFLELLLRLSLYAVRITRPGSNTDLVEAIPMNYIVFAEKCLELATQLYKAFANSEVLRNANGLLKMVEALHVPLAAKYKCQCRSTWLLASKCFMETIAIGVPIATKQKSSLPKTANGELWNLVYITIRDFLFCQNQPVEPLSGEEFQQHEALDCKFIELICDRFLSRPEGLPPRFIEQLIGVLGLGSVEASISSADFALLDPNTLRPGPPTPPPLAPTGFQPFVHRPSTISTASTSGAADAAAFITSIDGDMRPFVSREKFMRRCFESLLSFAFFQSDFSPCNSSTSSQSSLKLPAVGSKPHVLCRTAIRDVLDRCRFILQRFAKSAQLTGKCPLPRAKLSEVSFAFQALTVLLTNFTAPPTNSKTSIDANTWSCVIDIYPLVVNCIFVAESSQLLPAIHKLLQLYGRLLQPKANRTVETP